MRNNSLFASVEKLWNAWELSTMMLISLFLQIFLVLFANQRKHTVKDWWRMFIWLAYLSADWVAITALGVLARSETDPTSPFSIPAFWAPILLMHLGGPDSITAYSAQDNDLWLRHLLVLVIDVGLAFYVLVKFWSNYTIACVALPIFIAGVSKYGERNWALRSACFKIFRREGGSITRRDLDGPDPCNVPEAKFFHEVYCLFRWSKIIIKDIPLVPAATTLFLRNKTASEAFKLIEVELSFMYDLFYTKRRPINVQTITLRFMSFLCSLSALVAFSLTVTQHPYSKIDAVVSYILLGGAVFLEIYSAIVLAFSDWAMVWLSSQKMPLAANSVFRVLYSCRLRSFLNDKGWSSYMAQHDVMFATLREPKYSWKKWLGLDDNIQRWEAVGDDLKNLIFNEIFEKSPGYSPSSTDDLNFVNRLFTERGGEVLRKKDCLADFGWSVVEVEFIHSLLTWHLATDLCYHDEFRRSRHNANSLCSSCRMSKSLSDYMMYLLLNYPFFMPGGIAESRYRETQREFNGISINVQAASNTIDWDAVYRSVRALAVRNRSGLSAATDGCKLFLSLQSLDEKEGWSNEKKWEMTSQVWVEMLIYVATRCGWKEHFENLAQGGELLTHVALLVAQFYAYYSVSWLF